jgi:deoxyribonuclease-4
MKIGSFLSLKSPGYLEETLKISNEIGENCIMVYTGAPQSTIRVPLSQLKINEFNSLADKTNFDLNNLIVHAPYIVNPATSDKNKSIFTIESLKKEIERTFYIGSNKIVVHPGNAIGITVDQGIINCANAINELNKTNPGVIICIETMSGKGTEIGSNFNELAKIISLIENKKLIGVCMDTCHL